MRFFARQLLKIIKIFNLQDRKKETDKRKQAELKNKTN